MKPLALFLALLLSGCAAAPAAQVPVPPELVLQSSPALRMLGRDIQACSLSLGPLPVVVKELDPAAMDLASADLTLTAVKPAAADNPAYQIGSDRLVVAVNLANPVQSLTLIQLQGLLLGFIRDWGEVNGAGSGLTGTAVVPVELLPGSELQDLVLERLTGGRKSGYTAVRLADPQEVSQRIAAETGAIGFIPKSALGEGMRPVPVEGLPENALEYPILAQASSQPNGGAAALLGCLQERLRSQGQR